MLNRAMNDRAISSGLVRDKFSFKLTATLAVGMTTLVMACGTQASGGAGSYRIATASSEPRLLTILGGKLYGRANGDGTACLWIGDGPSRTAVIWPLGSSAHGNPLAVDDANGTRIGVVGEQLQLGGGLVVSSDQRQTLGCSGLGQSVIAGPLRMPREAIPDSKQFTDLEVGHIQEIVNTYRDVFGGLWGDPSTHVITIWLAPGSDRNRSAAALAALSAIPSGDASNDLAWRVGFEAGTRSLAQLDVVLTSVTSVQPWRSLVGDHLVSWGIDPVHQAVTAGVDLLTPAIAGEALRRFDGLVILDMASERPHPLVGAVPDLKRA